MKINLTVRQESHAGCLGLVVLRYHAESFLWQQVCPESNLYILFQMHLHPAGSLLCNGSGTHPHMVGAEHILYVIKLKCKKKCYHVMHLISILSTLILIYKKYCKLVCLDWQYYLHDGNMVTTLDDT